MTPFPRNHPPDLDDLRSIADHDWAAFRNLHRMETHWQRPGWTVGRRSYHWMLTFDGYGQLARHVTRCQQVVPAIGFDLVDTAAVHLTLGRIGFTDEVRRPALSAVLRKVADACERPSAFDLEIGPITGSRGAIRFSVGPWTPLLTVHAFLATATSAALGSVGVGVGVMDTDSFRPHLTIAYANASHDVEEVAAELVRSREVQGPRLRIGAVSLVLLERLPRAYRITVVEQFPLVGKASLSAAPP